LRDELRGAWERCGGDTRHARVLLETTRVEVVDIVNVTADDAHASEIRCLREAAWSLELPDAFSSPHDTWTVDL
jgi:hypothetical protein